MPGQIERNLPRQQVVDTRKYTAAKIFVVLGDREFDPRAELSVTEAGWITPESTPPAPFLITALTRLHEHKPADKPEAVLSIGLPVITDDKRQNEMQSLFTPPSPEHATKQDGELGFFLTEWMADHVLNHITAYSPEGGFKTTREVALTEFDPKGNFDISQTTLTSGGKKTALDNIHAALCKLTPDGQKVQRIDVSGRSVLDAIEEIEAAFKEGKYIELMLTDSTKLTSDEKEAIKRLVNIGGVMIVDTVTEPLDDKSLGTDREIGNLVITLEDTKQARMTGVNLIAGNPAVVKAVQDSFTALEGTTATTQQNFREAMNKINTQPLFASIKDQLLNMTDEEIDALAVPATHTFIRDLVRLFRNGVKYYSGNETALDDHKSFTRERVLKLEEQAAALNPNLYPDRQVFVANGAARGGLSSQYKVLADLGFSRVLIPKPMWPYNDLEGNNQLTASGNKIEFEYMDDIFYVDKIVDGIIHIGYDETRLEGRIKELGEAREKIALQLFSGIHNPTSYILSYEQKKQIAALSEKYGLAILSDDTYLHETFDEKDMHTFAQAANEIGSANDISTSTCTKDDSHAGARISFLYFRNPDLYGQLAEYRDLDSINIVSVLLESALMSDPAALSQRRKNTMAEAKHRVELAARQADKDGIDHNIPPGALYMLAALPGFQGSETPPLEVAKSHAKLGAGVLPVEKVLGGSSKYNGICRMALAGDATTDDAWTDRLAYVTEASQNIASSKKKGTT